MAQTFTRKKSKATTTPSTIYTIPAVTTSLIQSIHCANILAVGDAYLDIWWTDAQDSNAVVYIVRNLYLPYSSALNVLNRPLVLSAGDTLRVQATFTNCADVSVSILETT